MRRPQPRFLLLLLFAGGPFAGLRADELYYAEATIELLGGAPTVLQTDTQKQPPISEEEYATRTAIFDQPALAEAVAGRFSDEQRTRLLAPYLATGTQEKPPTVAEVVFKYRSVERNLSARRVRIGFSHPDTEIAALTANFYADEFVKHEVRERVEASMAEAKTMPDKARQLRATITEQRAKLARYREAARTSPLTPAEQAPLKRLEKDLKANRSELKRIERLLDPQGSQAVLIIPHNRIVERAKPLAATATVD